MHRPISHQSITQYNNVNIYWYVKYIAIDFMHIKNSLDPVGSKSHDVLLGKSSHFFLFLSVDKSRPCVLFGWFRPRKKVFSLRHVYCCQNVTNLSPDVSAASSRMHKEKYNLIVLLESVFSLSYCFWPRHLFIRILSYTLFNYLVKLSLWTWIYTLTIPI